jgi:hypothetical protein
LYSPNYPSATRYFVAGSWSPDAKGTITGFAGVKFANNDFGWLHFKLTTDLGFTNSLTLIDWAYQSVPGASIHVGNTSNYTFGARALNSGPDGSRRSRHGGAASAAETGEKYRLGSLSSL